MNRRSVRGHCAEPELQKKGDHLLWSQGIGDLVSAPVTPTHEGSFV